MSCIIWSIISYCLGYHAGYDATWLGLSGVADMNRAVLILPIIIATILGLLHIQTHNALDPYRIEFDKECQAH